MKHAARMVVALTFCGASAALALVGSACLDTTPFFVVPDGAPPPIDAAPPLDDAGDAGDVDLRGPCQRCIESPDDGGSGCGDHYDLCAADPKCLATYECMLGDQCITRSSSVREVILCGLPCATEAGIRSQVEPSALLILAVAQCASTNCTATCAPYLLDGGGD